MPNYKLPSIKNVAFDVLEKTKAFVFGAGKIILALSVVLWFLASNGPKSYKNAAENVTNNIEKDVLKMAPNAKSAPHIGGGHFYQWTRAEELSDILISFIKE